VACDNKAEAQKVYDRYINLIYRFGGEISTSKTLLSDRFAEGVGAIFLKDYPKEIRVPNGKLSTLEAYCKGTWLYHSIVQKSPIGRSILSNWLSTKLEGKYTFHQRRMMNEELVTLDLDHLQLDALRELANGKESMPQTYSLLDDDLPNFWRKSKKQVASPFKWVSRKAFSDQLVSHKIVTLYKESKHGKNNK